MRFTPVRKARERGTSIGCTCLRYIPCEMHAHIRCTLVRRMPCEIHACERHVHKSAGVHPIGVCPRGSDFSIWVFGKGSLYPTVHLHLLPRPLLLCTLILATLKGIIKQHSLVFETCSICHVRMIYERRPAAGGWVGRRSSKIVDYEDRRSEDCNSLTTASCPFAAA